jgi:hypothetical protein
MQALHGSKFEIVEFCDPTPPEGAQPKNKGGLQTKN